MQILVTAGPTYEPLDEVRRLTNFSTGKLGVELAHFFVQQNHEVTLLLGHYATYRYQSQDLRVVEFSTTSDLQQRLAAFAGQDFHAVFHAAAVSDFGFGQLVLQSPNGAKEPLSSAKIPTRIENLWVELVPTPKIIAGLRAWFPRALLVGWKYELEGNPSQTIEKGQLQITANNTNACIVNGRAYGSGFGVVRLGLPVQHCPQMEDLFIALSQMLNEWPKARSMQPNLP